MDPAQEAELKHQRFRSIYGEDWQFAPGWTEEAVTRRLSDITTFARLNSRDVIPLERRRSIARLADDLLAELRGLGGLPDEFLQTLRLLGERPEWRTEAQSKSARDGDRRSGERSFECSVLAMIVRLYCEAQETPGYSDNGPMVRFANTVGRRVFSIDQDPFTSNAVKAEFRRMKPKLKRPRRLASLYKHMTTE